jgi:hypothetical protein
MAQAAQFKEALQENRQKFYRWKTDNEVLTYEFITSCPLKSLVQLSQGGRQPSALLLSLKRGNDVSNVVWRPKASGGTGFGHSFQ